jgi:hypothetical protein
MRLFADGELREVLETHFVSIVTKFEQMSENDVLGRSIDDLIGDLLGQAALEPLEVGAERIDGTITETRIDVSNRFDYGGGVARGYTLRAIYEFSGDPQLFRWRPSSWLMISLEAAVGTGTLTIEATVPQEASHDAINRELSNRIDQIRTMAQHVKADVDRFNAGLVGRFQHVVERRKQEIQKRRDLAGALGFPLQRRTDAPTPVPLKRKVVGVPSRSGQKSDDTYRDEPALTESQYEDAIQVVSSTLLAMERTPSVASGKDEEDLRDQILVQLNGTFEGAATGETFVQNGKTDVLIRVENRHVFVGECKWWTGEKAFAAAIGQLLGYLPWRDEKAALILFIDRKDASAVIEKAEEAVRGHDAYKRAGKISSDLSRRRNFVLGQPGDPNREIQLAVLFAVLPKS